MTHDQIDRMVRKANPLPDLNALEPVGVPVLATPLERRTEMQIDDRPGTEVQPDRNRWRGPLVGIAAAAVILIAGLVFFLTRDDARWLSPPRCDRDHRDEMEMPLAPGAYFVTPTATKRRRSEAPSSSKARDGRRCFPGPGKVSG